MTARVTAAKFVFSWVPSQNGLVPECLQRPLQRVLTSGAGVSEAK